HFRMGFTPSKGTEIQSEYLLPREHAVAAIESLRGIADALVPLPQVTAIRTVAADDHRRSPDYEHDVVGFDFAALREAATVAAAPRIAYFRELVARTDPDGVFRNAYLDRLVL